MSFFWETKEQTAAKQKEKMEQTSAKQADGNKIKELLVHYAQYISKKNPSVVISGTEIENSKYLNKCFVLTTDERDHEWTYVGKLVYKPHLHLGYAFMAPNEYYMVDDYNYVDPHSHHLLRWEKYVIVPSKEELEAEAKKIQGNFSLPQKFDIVFVRMMDGTKEKVDEILKLLKDGYPKNDKNFMDNFYNIVKKVNDILESKKTLKDDKEIIEKYNEFITRGTRLFHLNENLTHEKNITPTTNANYKNISSVVKTANNYARNAIKSILNETGNMLKKTPNDKNSAKMYINSMLSTKKELLTPSILSQYRDIFKSEYTPPTSGGYKSCRKTRKHKNRKSKTRKH